MENKSVRVWYHANCFDGFGAAFAAWKSWGSGAEYIPVSYGKPPPDATGAGFVYIVDFSFKKNVMIELCQKNPTTQFVIIDHHKTAEADLKDLGETKPPNLDVHFDMTRSGALLTWLYFNYGLVTPGLTDYVRLPKGLFVPSFIEYISDRDLWTKKLPGVNEHHAALGSYPFDFEVWNKLCYDNPDQRELIAEGVALLRQQTVAVKKICDKQFFGFVGEDSCPMVNTSVHWSEVGEELLKRNPDHRFAASFTIFEDQVMWSLRSRADDPNGGFDVSEVAKKFGGGGHRNAAGFSAVRP